MAITTSNFWAGTRWPTPCSRWRWARNSDWTGRPSSTAWPFAPRPKCACNCAVPAASGCLTTLTMPTPIPCWPRCKRCATCPAPAAGWRCWGTWPNWANLRRPPMPKSAGARRNSTWTNYSPWAAQAGEIADRGAARRFANGGGNSGSGNGRPRRAGICPARRRGPGQGLPLHAPGTDHRSVADESAKGAAAINMLYYLSQKILALAKHTSFEAGGFAVAAFQLHHISQRGRGGDGACC